MGIKQRPSPGNANALSVASWGSVADESARVVALRFEWSDRSVSFPYTALLRWEWLGGDTESLLMTFGKELVSVRGRSLEALRDGLDRGRLQSVREQGERHAEAGAGTLIRSITIELR
jgi:hypothetical protein